MKRLIAILIISVIGSTAAQDNHSTGDYWMDLGAVYGAIQSAKFMGDICTESFPNQSTANTNAYTEWRSKYLPFIQEMELTFSTSMWKESGGDPQKYYNEITKFRDGMDKYRASMKSQMAADGPKTFEGQCSVYPIYLATDRMNLEHYYAEQLEVIRKGPSKSP